MSRPSSSRPNFAAARAFVRVGWRPLVAALYRHATIRLGLARIGAKRGRLIEALDLVHTLIMKALEGRLSWDLRETAPRAEVLAYACSKLRGVAP